MIPPTTNAEYLWFFNTLVRFGTGFGDGTDGLSLIEHRAAMGDSPPLHIHRTEDELFYILEGDFRFQIGAESRRASAGVAMLAPKGVPHTYCIDSPTGGRWLTVTRNGDFERFVRAMGRPATRIELPPFAPPPSAEMIEEVSKIALAHHIELCGPPLT